jgi:hypothetical protein
MIFPLFVSYTVIARLNTSCRLILLQGGITIIWLTVQLFINIEFFLPEIHYPTYSAGFLLLVIGFLLFRIQKEDKEV